MEAVKLLFEIVVLIGTILGFIWGAFKYHQTIKDSINSNKEKNDLILKQLSELTTKLETATKISNYELKTNGGKSLKDVLLKAYALLQTLVSKEEINFYLDHQPKYECDSNGNLIKANYKWREITGMSENDALAKQWIKSVHPDDRNKVNDAWEGFLTKQYPFEITHRIVNIDTLEVYTVMSRAIQKTKDNDIDTIVGTFEIISIKPHEEITRLRKTA